MDEDWHRTLNGGSALWVESESFLQAFRWLCALPAAETAQLGFAWGHLAPDISFDAWLKEILSESPDRSFISERDEFHVEPAFTSPPQEKEEHDLKAETDALAAIELMLREENWYVMLPRARADKGSGLREWDLWGPLVLCLALGIMLSMRADQASLAFALVFVIVWVGSGIVTLNAVLLKGKISFFQSVCVLGYCIFPLVIAAFCSLLLQVIWLKVIFVCVGFTWATGASVAFMSELLPEDRKALGVYPVWLFYVAIAWLILIS
ncbi:yipf6 [Symbiodinium sp. KB8]|nr:yipf6 [Symbiodinium sp. KB8]